MLTIYLGKTPEKVIRSNDGWFSEYLGQVDFTDPIVKQTMLDIDRANYINHNYMTTKFSKVGAVRVDELSTGCKTIINIHTFPDKIFTIDECGNNAIKKILSLSNGNVTLTFPRYISSIINPIKLIVSIEGNNKIITTIQELNRIIKLYFENLNKALIE